MTTDDMAMNLIDVLGQRSGLLECLQENPKDKRTLTEETEVSRSTLDRGVRELESLNLIEYTDGCYETTLCGELALNEYQHFVDAMETLCRLQPFLQWIPSTAFDLDLRWLADADLFTPKSGDPYAMVNHHVEVLHESEYSQLLLPVTGQHAHEALHDNIVNHSAECETVVTPAVADTWQSKQEYAELFEEMVATGRIHVSIYDDAIPYFVGVFDHETVQIGVDEDGDPRALVETDRNEVVEWAEQKIDDYKQDSQALV